MRPLGIVRRLTGCYYCGRPVRGRAEVCGYCSDLPLRDPLVAKARQVLSEAERIEARMSAENRWQVAIRRATQVTADALAEVNAKAPLPRYPLRRRILWRLRRHVPDEVRREQLRVRQTRAQLLTDALQRHHQAGR